MTSHEFDALVRQRRSVRGFRDQAVPQGQIRQALETALWAPSNCNVQPWLVHVVSGDSLRALGQKMIARSQQGAPNPDVPMDTPYRGIFRDRQIGSAKALYGAMQIARDDHAGRAAAFQRNLDAFGAPHAAFIFLPAGFSTREAADLGGFVQTLMLALTAQGLGTCPQGALSLYPDLVRAHLGLTTADQLMCGIAFGFIDPDHPTATALTDRAPLDTLVQFHD